MILKDNRLKIFLHIILWSIIILFPIYILKTSENADLRPMSHFFTNTFFYALIFYINYLYLIPKLLFKQKKRILFIISEIAIISVFFFLVNHINFELYSKNESNQKLMEALSKINEGRAPMHTSMELFRIFNFTFSSVMIIGFAFGLNLVDKIHEDDKRRKELEQAKLHSELAFLKYQISPHFFFNTLNNIYVLTSIDTAAAQESILKLSNLMRYLLYESENGQTLISREIEFMNNYITLMKLRISPKVELKIDFPEKYADTNIPPLLFISFIENAFKHGISNREKSFIHIKMEIFGDGSIVFSSHNSQGKSQQPSDSAHSGIGLENVKKRLELLYPNRYNLELNSTDEDFKVILKLQPFDQKKELPTNKGLTIQNEQKS